MNRRLSRRYSPLYFKSIDSVIFSLAGFSVLMIIIRVLLTARFTFMFLFWNLFLALIPLCITSLLFFRIRILENKFLFLLFVSVWIAFLPNTFYLITDLIHLKPVLNLPQWYDLTLLFSFALTGLLIGIITIHRMEFFFQLVFPLINGIRFILPVMFLSAAGVYLGRFQRYNSWDILTDTPSLLKHIYAFIMNPAIYQSAWAMIGCFTIFLFLTYRCFSELRNISRNSEG